MRPPPRLETSRLVLRFPTPADAAALAHYVAENREHFRRAGPTRDPSYFTPAYWAGMVAAIERDWRDDRHCHFIVFEADDCTPVGRARFSDFTRGAAQSCNLGYEIAKSHEGRGLMFEALRAAIAYVFEELNLHRIQAGYLPDNERSARLLARLGFTREGFAKDYIRVDGQWEDHVLNSLTNSNWRP